jgi:hypothetical protein
MMLENDLRKLHEHVQRLVVARHSSSTDQPTEILSKSSTDCNPPARDSLVKPSATWSLQSTTTIGTPNLLDFEDFTRLKDGTERRTTLMIKRIPRRYTLSILRKEVDCVLGESGLYDLLYLPVDSAKMTNRGYAFVNFVTPVAVQKFVEAFTDRVWSEWNRHGKAAVICWANVQGKELTLAHIRAENSVDDSQTVL